MKMLDKSIILNSSFDYGMLWDYALEFVEEDFLLKIGSILWDPFEDIFDSIKSQTEYLAECHIQL